MDLAVDRDDISAGAPTPERAAIANGYLLEQPIYDRPTGANRIPIGTGFRIATPVYKMFLDGRISQEHHDAAEKLYVDYVIGTRQTGLVQKYQYRIPAGETPLNQLINAEASLSPEERRSLHHNRYIDARRKVGTRKAADWMTAIVCEIPIGADAKSPTLADLGRDYMAYGSVKQQTAAGAALVKFWLELVAPIYGIEVR